MKKTFAIMLLISALVTSFLFAYGTEISDSVEDVTDITKEEETKYLKKLSLEQAIEEGIKNSPLIKAAELEIKVKELDLRQAKRQESKYKDSGFSAGTVEGFQLDANMYSKSAKFALEEEKLKKEYTIEDIKHNVISTYYGVLQTEDFVNISKVTLENIQMVTGDRYR